MCLLCCFDNEEKITFLLFEIEFYSISYLGETTAGPARPGPAIIPSGPFGTGPALDSSWRKNLQTLLDMLRYDRLYTSTRSVLSFHFYRTAF
jgi:hypothetical protein